MKLETAPTPQEQFFQYTQGIIGGYLKEKIEKASDTDSISGKISGEIKTVPRSFIDLSFDTDKNNLESTIERLLKEEFSKMNIDSNTEYNELTADIITAPETEKDKPAEERNGLGGYTAFIYKQ